MTSADHRRDPLAAPTAPTSPTSTRPSRVVALEGQRAAASPDGTPEREIAVLLDAGDQAGAAAAALRAHGAEIFGFLLGALGRGGAARDVYGSLGERVRRDLGGFDWRGSLRTWMYSRARDELRSYALQVEGRTAEYSPVPAGMPDPTTTVPCRRTDLGAAIAALRSSLSLDDRALLILRVDRGLSLEDLAVIELGPGASPGDAGRAADQIRRRLARIRDQLGRIAFAHRVLGTR